MPHPAGIDGIAQDMIQVAAAERLVAAFASLAGYPFRRQNPVLVQVCCKPAWSCQINLVISGYLPVRVAICPE